MIMFEFYPYATEKGNIPDTTVSKINFPNNNFGPSILEYTKEGLFEIALTNSFGRFITGNAAEYKYSCTLAEINAYLRIWGEY